MNLSVKVNLTNTLIVSQRNKGASSDSRELLEGINLYPAIKYARKIIVENNL